MGFNMYHTFKKIITLCSNLIHTITRIISALINQLKKLKIYLYSNDTLNKFLLKNLIISIITMLIFRKSMIVIWYFIISLYSLAYNTILDLFIFILKSLNNLISKIPALFKILISILFTLFSFIAICLITLIIVTMIPFPLYFNQEPFVSILVCLFFSLLVMLVVSLIFNYCFVKKFNSSLTLYTVTTLLQFITGICFTALLGLKDSIIYYLEWYITKEQGTKFISDFLTEFHIPISEAIPILLYWIFALSLCFQTTHKIAKKVVTNQNNSQNPDESDSNLK